MKITPFLSRRYTVVGEPGREVLLTISAPKRWRQDWACQVRVRVDGTPKGSTLAPGIDPLQAIQLALEGARHLLDASGLALVWAGGETPGDVGIPLPVPTTYGFEMQRTWERYLLAERARLTSEMAARIGRS